MPSSKAAHAPPYSKDEAVLCFHGEMLYEAKVLDTRQGEDQAWQYKIHYKGWKATWDDWVPQDRVRKFTEENKELAASLLKQMKIVKDKSGSSSKNKKTVKAGGSDLSSIRGSEERNAANAAHGGGRGPRRGRDQELESEEQHNARPQCKVILCDALKALLVGDWENVTKGKMLVPLPSAHPVNSLLDEYHQAQIDKGNRTEPQLAVLVEVIAGLKIYFDHTLARILLYSFERIQYEEIKAQWNNPTSSLHGKTSGETYGAEHLCRLFSQLPELIPQTNMDQQSVDRLREEVLTMSNWIADNSVRLFTSEYEAASQSYIEKSARE